MNFNDPISKQVDLHIVVILLLVVPLSLFILPFVWALCVIAAVPQGRIFTRAVVDLPAFKQPAKSYVVANEVLVALIVVSCAVGQHFLHRLT